MKILHYSLGFPPYAVGGLTKYCMDLAEEQLMQGHDVSVLWPGKISKEQVTTVKSHGSNLGIGSFELVGKNYLPQIYGIHNTDLFMQETDVSAVGEFLDREQFDVIHFHTLMGLNASIVEEIKKHDVKTVYTTHDFFGICPKTMMFFDGHSCKDNDQCEGCEVCCANALSQAKMELLQSKKYRMIKTNPLMKVIRKNQKSKKFEADKKVTQEKESTEEEKKKYQDLRKYFIKILKEMDVIHYNSSYMKEIFDKYFENNGKVINIVHNGIDGNADIDEKYFHDNDIINITYIGAIADYKGYYMLVKALDSLRVKGYNNFVLNVYGQVPEKKAYMAVHPPFKNEERGYILNNADILVNPHDVSYGFTVLEAISQGTPVVVSNEVGAKDWVENGKTGIICAYEFYIFRDAIESLISNPEKISEMRNNIKESVKIPTMQRHTEDIINELYK